jgi:hypothetical protein
MKMLNLALVLLASTSAFAGGPTPVAGMILQKAMIGGFVAPANRNYTCTIFANGVTEQNASGIISSGANATFNRTVKKKLNSIYKAIDAASDGILESGPQGPSDMPTIFYTAIDSDGKFFTLGKGGFITATSNKPEAAALIKLINTNCR